MTSLVERFLPTMPHFCRHRRRIPSSGAISHALCIPPRTIQRKMLSTAAAMYYGSRCLAGGLISRIINLEMNEQVTVEAVITFTSYDETPMVVRARAEGKAKADAKPATSKLLQSEVELGIFTRHGERYDLSLVWLPCPVHMLHRGTGEALKASLGELVDDIPFLHSLQSVNSNVFVCGVSAADRAAANNKAENGMYYERPGLRLRLPCFAHTAQTAVGR